MMDPAKAKRLTANFLQSLRVPESNKSKLTKDEIKRLVDLFLANVENGGQMDRERFKKIIKTKNEFFVNRLFDIFDTDNSNTISLQEFLNGVGEIAGGGVEEKAHFLFKVYDADGDGVINCEDLGKVMRACLAENGMKFSDAETDQLTRALFEDADVDGRGVLTFRALRTQLMQHEGLLENMSILVDQWLLPPESPPSAKTCTKLCPYRCSLNYIKNNYVFIIWRLLFFITNMALFSNRCRKFYEMIPRPTIYLIVARGAGQCLNFNCTLIVILMFRQCLTFLRAKGASSFFPIDQHIDFHKLTGKFIFFYAVLHTIMHLLNIQFGLLPSEVVNSGNWTYLDFLFVPEPTSQKGILSLGLIPGYAFNTGVLLMIVLTIMVIGTLPFVRGGGRFEVFYWTHLLYYPFWIALIIHAPNFWKWFVAPGAIFLIEQIVRLYKWRFGSGKTCVNSGILLPSKVTHLVIDRPRNFEYHPGDYVFVKIPKIAKAEWHPFTISSSPEQEGTISLHIRACGEWTNRLYNYFEKEQKKIKPLVPVPRPRQSKPSTLAAATVNERVIIPRPPPPPVPTKPGTIQEPNQSSTLPSIARRTGRIRRQPSAVASYIYMRNKPTVISLETIGQQRDLNRQCGVFGSNLSVNQIRFGDGRNEVRPTTSRRMETHANASEAIEMQSLLETTRPVGKPLEIYLDGPHGAPSSHIFRAEHAVLIATGIGVTPFASILQSIMHRYWASRNCCPKCDFKWVGELPQSVLNLRKVDFFWINRDQKSFEWFVHLLSQLEIEQAEEYGQMEHFLDMHMYITSALQKTDMQAVGLQMALDLLHEKEQRDLITGLKTRTNAGRPNWKNVFQQIKSQNKGKVTIFYCGPPALARTLKRMCDEFDFEFKKEIF